MDRLKVTGKATLSGEVRISSAKNACLPIMMGVLLNDKKTVLKNLPDLRDVRTTVKLLQEMGVSVDKDGKDFTFQAKDLKQYEAPYDLVKTMRASILVLGPLLSRFKKAKVSLPGGCAIGARPIDIHLDGLKKLGADINLTSGYVEAQTTGLRGEKITLNFPSVGATENLMMAAVYAQGETLIENAAREPEIVDLANFLNAMGAKIENAGESSIHIQGVEELKDTQYEVIGDRIEAMTYIMAAMASNSSVLIQNCNTNSFSNVFEVLKEMGGRFEVVNDSELKVLSHSGLKGTSIETAPYPGYPTDGQAQLMALATQCEGTSILTEKIFENRFMHVPELQRMGAQIELKGNSAVVQGATPLSAAPVMCTDLRASAALVIAALVADGETEISRVYHLDRGYEELDLKLKKLGVKVERFNPDV
jgi:UDP-N-acetylglucosamine 1-carboxyvinyltransferase